jgi:threonine synthase
LPVKFAATIAEALGREPEPSPGFEDLERRTQRFEVVEADVDAVKRIIAGAGQNPGQAAT